MKRSVVMILLAGALTLSMIAPSALPAVAGNVSVVHAAVKTSNDAAVKASNDAAAKTSNDVTAETSSDEDAGEWKDKTETVYVDANADGSVKKITVKDWLRRNGDGEIIDFSNLKDIKNTEGDEEYTQNADGTITWENKGEDISYEGTSNQQLPVTTKVTYYLDGKEIKPEDLAGKSGKVKIRFDYTNNESRTVNIDGKDLEVKVPFLAASMLMLPGDKFKNVKVSGGKVMADQDQSIVIGTAFPGLADSLELKDYEATKDIDLKDYVEITADVENFELDFTATAISTCGLSDMKDGDLDDVNDMIGGVKEMTGASDELVDAMGQLSTGAGTLQDYLSQYTSGVSQVDAGAQALAEGLSELDEQVTTLMGSLGSAGSDDTTAQAVTQIQKDLGIFQQQLVIVTTLAEYVNTIRENVTTAKSELDKINVTDLETEASNQAKEKAKNAVNTAIYETEVSTKKDIMDRLKETDGYKSLTPEQQEELEKAVNAASGTSSSAETECDSMNISLTDASGAKKAIGQAVIALEEVKTKQVDTTTAQKALADLVTQFTALSDSLSDMPDKAEIGGKLQSAISQLAQGAATLSTGTSQLSSVGTQLNTGAGTLAQGASLLEAGMKTFDEEGIEKLGDLAGNDLANVLNHFKAVKEAEKELAEEIEFYRFQQYCFTTQWRKLKAYANKKGISIIGDVPIYVALDSSDAWANPEMLQFDEDYDPKAVAGCPPDAFSATGQLWGNPLYAWDYHKKTGYDWWMKRVACCFKLYDIIRIDHFRGFDEYYAIPYGDETAENGEWMPGPGMDLFLKMKETLGDLPIIAEDLGFLTDTVRQLLKDSGYPGMKVLEFAFVAGEDSDYLPHNYDKNCVVYTGTHDNDTLQGWYQTLSEEDKEMTKEYLNNPYTPDEEVHWDFISLAMRSVADTCIIPVQDYLGLGNKN